jgi:hypothetical protein
LFFSQGTYQETASVLSEKAKYSAQEAALLNQKAMEAEAQVQQLKVTVMRSVKSM